MSNEINPPDSYRGYLGELEIQVNIEIQLRTRLETAIEKSGLSWQMRVKIYRFQTDFNFINGPKIHLLKKELQQRRRNK